jgi:hypothetical protein
MDSQRPCAGTNLWCLGRLWGLNRPIEGLWEAYGPVGAGILSAQRGDIVVYHLISVWFEFRSDGLIRSPLFSLVHPVTFWLLFCHGSPFFHRPSFFPTKGFWLWFTEGSWFDSHVGASLCFPVFRLCADRVGVLKGRSVSPYTCVSTCSSLLLYARSVYKGASLPYFVLYTKYTCFYPLNKI